MIESELEEDDRKSILYPFLSIPMLPHDVCLLSLVLFPLPEARCCDFVTTLEAVCCMSVLIVSRYHYIFFFLLHFYCSVERWVPLDRCIFTIFLLLLLRLV